MAIAKRGDLVSLVTTKRLFFFQTEGGISLNAENNSSATIPETATDEHLKQINTALSNGHLVLGDVFIKANVPERDSDIATILSGGRNGVDKWVDEIMRDKSIRNEERSSILEKALAMETAGKNRKSVTRVIERRLKNIAGISQVTESDQQKIEIQLTTNL